MAGVPQFVDISAYQGAIDFSAYCAWARQWDGIARIAMKATEGTGFVDPLFRDNRDAAIAAGVDCIYYYHYGRPDLSSASTEADFMHYVVGAIRDSDMLILDYEVTSQYANAEWAYEWLDRQEANYGGKLPGIYASTAYIQEKLRLNALSIFPLWLANWQFTPDERPPVPFPWSSYEFVQFTDRAVNIPGIPGAVDCNIFLGKEEVTPMSQVPTGWSDDGSTLKGPDGTPVRLGFRDHVLNNNWDPGNVPLQPEQHLTILEQSNPGLGSGQSQIFKMDRLEDTPKMGVFAGWIGQELLWYQKHYTALQTQVALLQSQVADLQAQLSGNTLAQENAALLAKIAQAQKDLS